MVGCSQGHLEAKHDGVIGETPLAHAAKMGEWEVVKELAALNANLEAKLSFKGMTPLAWAAFWSALRQGHDWRLVKELVALNANLEANDEDGMTPIALAANQDQWEAVTELAALNANLGANDKDGMTPIQLASEKGQLEVVEVLKAHHQESMRKTLGNPPALSGKQRLHALGVDNSDSE